MLLTLPGASCRICKMCQIFCSNVRFRTDALYSRMLQCWRFSTYNYLSIARLVAGLFLTRAFARMASYSPNNRMLITPAAEASVAAINKAYDQSDE
jgi:hypothetical protein